MGWRSVVTPWSACQDRVVSGKPRRCSLAAGFHSNQRLRPVCCSSTAQGAVFARRAAVAKHHDISHSRPRETGRSKGECSSALLDREMTQRPESLARQVLESVAELARYSRYSAEPSQLGLCRLIPQGETNQACCLLLSADQGLPGSVSTRIRKRRALCIDQTRTTLKQAITVSKESVMANPIRGTHSRVKPGFGNSRLTFGPLLSGGDPV